MHNIVIKQGILFKAVLGVFWDKAKAIEHCNKIAREDRDDWHDYYVYKIKLNKPYDNDGEFDQEDNIYEINHSKALALANLT